MLLNNELDDFTAAPGASNAYGLVGFEANLPGPGKRPLSSMSPTIVLKDGKPVLVTGSPGGSRIISTVLQVIVNVLDYKMDVAAAVAAPRLHHQWLPDEVRVERGFPGDMLFELKAMDTQSSSRWARPRPIRSRDAERPARRARSAHPRRRSGGTIAIAVCMAHGSVRPSLRKPAVRATERRPRNFRGNAMSTAEPIRRDGIAPRSRTPAFSPSIAT